MQASTEKESTRQRVTAERALSDNIGRGLSDYFEPVVHEPLPPKIAEALALLEATGSRPRRSS